MTTESTVPSPEIEALFAEERKFAPPPEFMAQANVHDDLYADVVHRSRNSNAAKAAVARKILIAAWHMLSRNEPFNPAPRRTSDAFVPASSRFALAA